MSPRVGLSARGSIVAVGDAEARLGLLGGQAFPAVFELVDDDSLDHVPLPGDQDVDTLQCFVDALAEPCNLNVVTDVTVRRRLPRPNEGVILPSESVNRCIQFAKVYVCRRQPLVVLGFQPPRKRPAQAVRALTKRKRFGFVRVAELLFDACDALACGLLLRSRQIIRPRRGQDGLQAFGEVLALLEAQTHPRIQLLELRVDLWQQRLIVLPAESDDIVESIETGLPS